MGYNNLDTDFSIYLSGTSQIAALSMEPSNTNVTGRWVFRVAEPKAFNPFAAACLEWSTFTPVIPFPFSILFFQPCPCNLFFAFIDRRYFFTSTFGCASTLVQRWGFYQMCCYDLNTWQLITHPSYAGYPTQHLKDLEPALFASNDQRHFENCCLYSEHCDIYRERRPVPTCFNYFRPWIAMGFGDPHIFTLDGFDYTYNPVGEFWLINSTEFKLQARMMQTLDESGELIQATQFQAVAMQSETPDELSDRIHVELNNNRTDFIVYQNEISLTPSLDETVSNATIKFNGGIIRKENGSISVVFNTGYSFTFSISLTTLNIESLVPDSANGTTNGLLGIFDGDQSNDITNANGTIVCAPNECTAQVIHEQFGESWRITQEESIFWYRGKGWNTETYTNRNFQPIYLNQDEVDADIKAACNDDVLCIYDAVATNSTELGMSTKAVFETVIANVMELNNVPPFVEGPATINASINNNVTVMYTYGNQEGQNGTVTLNVTSMPEGAHVVHMDNTWMMTWSPIDFTPVTLSMFAVKTDSVDSRQTTSSELNVDFRISPDCVHGSPQNFSQLAPGGTITVLYHIVQCICDLGWEGERCEDDIDGCKDSPCRNVNCTDVEAEIEEMTGQSFECENITCLEGFIKLSDDECFDYDECANDEHTCFSNVLCINTVGSFYCNCPQGYTKENETCIDIDECIANADTCSDICHNTNGSFECSCFSGASLKEDNVTCEVMVASGSLCGGEYNCSYTCANNTDGSEVCVCPRDKMVDPADNSTCIDFNECLNPDDNACVTSTGAQCEDLLNGYKCNCSIGYNVSESGFSCEKCSGTYGERCIQPCHCADRADRCDHIIGCTDCRPGWSGDQCMDNLDECIFNNTCPENFNCFDTPGSYRCDCADGFFAVLVNQTEMCQDIDECVTTQPCSQYAECVNTDGSFTCRCLEGYTGDGFVCSNINECAFGEHDCEMPLATCQDKVPGYGCFCQVGYYGDGKVNGTGCSDDNECLEVANPCPVEHAVCVNTIGSYICVCEEFYIGDGNIECRDIDECADPATNNCSTLVNGNETCINEEPLYRCDRECNTGYNLTEEDGTYSCVDIDECLEKVDACPVEHTICENTIGSHVCVCEPFYFGDGDIECQDIDECANTTTNNCSTLVNGNETCINEEPLYRCDRECNTGYNLTEEDGTYSCVDINECELSGYCSRDHEFCENTEGSFNCLCNESYTRVGEDCVDINECLLPGKCDGDNRKCTNVDPGYICACYIGYTEPDCEQDNNYAFVGVEQTLDIPYNSNWSNRLSAEFIFFQSEFEKTITALFNLSDFEGVNILSVEPSDDGSTLTKVTYEVVYSERPYDLEQRIYHRLVFSNNSLEFNGQIVQDLNLLKFGGRVWTCDDIMCTNNFECVLDTAAGYVYCNCSLLFSGYNCSRSTVSEPDSPSNLLVLWISVGIAGGLLIVGLAVCTSYFVIARKKKFVDRPRIHRFRRGPAIFNPSSRLPAEAFNYQFPTASVRDTDSSSDSTVSRSTDLTGRVGTLAGFAPRWPKAYYSQLDDADSH
ncbi:mucin-like protein [Watersipora subatra]|uniref:mucin-like protein n=1 Tax=Watersipora subatra TaxID=2589382 RepID=UPI00355C2594